MNMSRSRRLIVLLSYAYLEQDWCASNFRSACDFLSIPPRDVSVAVTLRCVFRKGLLHLLELCQHPAIVIVLEGQSKRMRPEVRQLISEHQHRLTVLTWRQNSVVRALRRHQCLNTVLSFREDQE